MITFARLLIGHIRGGLAQVNILVSMIFAGIQASCTADSAAIGGVLIPAMVREKYDKDFSVVVTATSSCCGPIIPPSILMVLYAFLTNTSVAKLFLGGAIPGVPWRQFLHQVFPLAPQIHLSLFGRGRGSALLHDP